jgi:hypothetical protein
VNGVTMEAKVLLVDLFRTRVLRFDQLFRLPDQLRDLPDIAVKIRLVCSV